MRKHIWASISLLSTIVLIVVINYSVLRIVSIQSDIEVLTTEVAKIQFWQLKQAEALEKYLDYVANSNGPAIEDRWKTVIHSRITNVEERLKNSIY